ncbi:MAG TPA: cbb3-type cytochrome c oxidase subunit 3 [Gammaproteobacteria bacterium]|nr:cbb3-type cytochrome c oxidase subunit 3 [Gammaproteobacteria bacterium]
MSTLFGHLVGVGIVGLMLVFLGIWYWAWRPRHKPTFDALARMPLLEDETETEIGAGLPREEAVRDVERRRRAR